MSDKDSLDALLALILVDEAARVVDYVQSLGLEWCGWKSAGPWKSAARMAAENLGVACEMWTVADALHDPVYRWWPSDEAEVVIASISEPHRARAALILCVATGDFGGKWSL